MGSVVSPTFSVRRGCSCSIDVYAAASDVYRMHTVAGGSSWDHYVQDDGVLDVYDWSVVGYLRFRASALDSCRSRWSRPGLGLASIRVVFVLLC